MNNNLPEDFSPKVAREVEQKELAHYKDHGWAFLKNLLSAEMARSMLIEARAMIERAKQSGPAHTSGFDDFWFSWNNSVFEARYMNQGPFVDIARCADMARAASHFIHTARPEGGPVAIRSLGGNLFCKMGNGSNWGKEIPFHQDGPSFHVREPGFVTIWLALDEVSPEQGTMRFLDGSHRAGPLEDHRSGYPLDRHPEVLDIYECTPGLRYAPGDATAHDGFTLHGSPENRTGEARWGYACLYVASDVPFDDRAYKERPHGFRAPLEQYPIVWR